LGRTGACRFDWIQELAHTCEGEATGGTRELHRRWRGTGSGNGAAAGGSTRWRKWLGHGRRVSLV
jgi:hypothetical protein